MRKYKKTIDKKIPEDNNLKAYLEYQVKEYKAECENLNALYTDLNLHIEECEAQIQSLKAKEDVGFSMLSPIAVDSAYQTQIKRLNAQLDAYGKQKEKYISDIRFYESKIAEMESQLEEYQKSERNRQTDNRDRQYPMTGVEKASEEKLSIQKNAANQYNDALNTATETSGKKPDYVIIDTSQNSSVKDSEQAEKEASVSSAEKLSSVSIKDEAGIDIQSQNENIKGESITNSPQSDVDEFKWQETVANLQKKLEQNNSNTKNQYIYIRRKLTDIKGYINFDMIRAKLEIEQLDEYLKKILDKVE